MKQAEAGRNPGSKFFYWILNRAAMTMGDAFKPKIAQIR